ncbi:hypothetical protein P7D22_16180 [Lichenihabitans sp. Uapishka_5]|uniref:hypothetical protein n=1 Tax=Lichenihabitans sp. Uapishka_5 TaxID=3037302 RepID=UPI0029E7D62E|nr:hypothetical protein [Lichenihabitans sp. Uapishka_5]MDX7952706.1 hypothetical protein [Lichenihabitans sp. Uapishka_5]
MNEAKALRALADKLDELEGLKAFPADIAEPGEVQVNWTEGRDHEGYATLSAAISTLVSQHWNALRSQVLKSKEGEVQAARAVCTGVSNGTTTEAPAGPDTIRKVG